MEYALFVGFVFYLTPFIVAAARDHDFTVGVLLLNLTLGWTGIGWFAALAWAFLPTSNLGASAYAPALAGAAPLRAAGMSPRILYRPQVSSSDAGDTKDRDGR